MAKVETVMVEAENDHGYMIINKDDMTEDHKIFKAPAAPSKTSDTEGEGEAKGEAGKPAKGGEAKPEPAKKA